MANENILEIQRDLVAMERAKAIAKAEKLKKDIRSQIARNGFYKPEEDPAYEYQPYPRWVEPANGKPVIVNNLEEERAVLGITGPAPKSVNVDIAALGQKETVKIKRGRPKKIVEQPLPPTIE